MCITVQASRDEEKWVRIRVKIAKMSENVHTAYLSKVIDIVTWKIKEPYIWPIVFTFSYLGKLRVISTAVLSAHTCPSAASKADSSREIKTP